LRLEALNELKYILNGDFQGVHIARTDSCKDVVYNICSIFADFIFVHYVMRGAPQKKTFAIMLHERFGVDYSPALNDKPG